MAQAVSGSDSGSIPYNEEDREKMDLFFSLLTDPKFDWVPHPSNFEDMNVASCMLEGNPWSKGEMVHVGGDVEDALYIHHTNVEEIMTCIDKDTTGFDIMDQFHEYIRNDRYIMHIDSSFVWDRDLHLRTVFAYTMGDNSFVQPSDMDAWRACPTRKCVQIQYSVPQTRPIEGEENYVRARALVSGLSLEMREGSDDPVLVYLATADLNGYIPKFIVAKELVENGTCVKKYVEFMRFAKKYRVGPPSARIEYPDGGIKACWDEFVKEKAQQ